ncbi:unnamed protein product [Adineta ricciae]|uniref:Uncharacterized protein n=1 Tax=Adineta ricciae TaxID=249248 RepID=A0A814PX91_ADIRI|nr:unnamed protein product [Adineta ricciae]CAF1111648.1 unnamed protein product [Adineta ricciae]
MTISAANFELHLHWTTCLRTTVLDDAIDEQQSPLPSPSQTSINQGSQNDIERTANQFTSIESRMAAIE